MSFSRVIYCIHGCRRFPKLLSFPWGDILYKWLSSFYQNFVVYSGDTLYTWMSSFSKFLSFLLGAERLSPLPYFFSPKKLPYFRIEQMWFIFWLGFSIVYEQLYFLGFCCLFLEFIFGTPVLRTWGDFWTESFCVDWLFILFNLLIL